jgi:hypothetical protein
MKKTIKLIQHSLGVLVAIMLIVVCGCNSFDSNTEQHESEMDDVAVSDSPENNKGSEKDEQEKPVEKVMPRYNYEGEVSGIPIRAQIEYGKAEHYGEFEEKWECRVTGYYYYKKIGSPIPLYGSCNSFGQINLECSLDGISETFDGSFDQSMLSDFSGTWRNDKKSLSFYLRSLD